MFIVRTDFKNGLHLEHNFAGTDGLGRAEKIREVIARTMQVALAEQKSAICEVWDDAGRQSTLDGSQIQHVSLVDVQSETIAAVRIKQFVQGLAMKHDPDAFRQQPDTGQRPNGPIQPAIGPQPNFAS